MKILVIYTGGTIGSANTDGSIAPSDDAKSLVVEMYKKEYGSEVEFEFANPYTILSENLDGKSLVSLAKAVKDGIAKGIYDGIIVTHGSDTIQYSSSMLCYALGLSTIPVMLVCSNYILSDERANGLENFVAAVEFIKAKLGTGVFVSYANEKGTTYIHRGSKLLAHEVFSDSLKSVDDMWYASYSDGTFTKNDSYKEMSDKMDTLNVEDLMETSGILFSTIHPGMIFPKFDRSLRAAIFQGYHSGTLSTGTEEMSEFASEAKDIGIPVFSCGAKVDGSNYASLDRFEELGITRLDGVSPIAMYMKAWLLAVNDIDIADNMMNPLGGDF